MRKKQQKKCRDADSYRGDALPRCGCETCTQVWQEAQRKRIVTANSPAFMKRHRLTRVER